MTDNEIFEYLERYRAKRLLRYAELANDVEIVAGIAITILPGTPIRQCFEDSIERHITALVSSKIDPPT